MSIITGPLYRHSAEQIKQMIDVEIAQLTEMVAKRPDWAAMYANSIEKLRGQYEVLDYLEKSFHALDLWAVESNWTQQQLLLAKYDDIAGLALQHPDDTGGSRLNDAKRAYNDGRREVLHHVRNRLLHSEWFPGNELTALNN